MEEETKVEVKGEEEEIERRQRVRDKKIKDVSVKKKEKLSTLPSEGKIDDEQTLPSYKVLPTEPVMSLSVPPPVLSIGTQGRIQIPSIQMKENLYSEILPPPKLRSLNDSRLVLPRPLISQVADLGIVRPPAVGLEVSTQLLLPLQPESSIEVSPLIDPPLMGYRQSITPKSRTFPLLESISITSTIQPLMSRFSLQSKLIDKEDILPTLDIERTSQEEKILSVGAEIAEELSGDDKEDDEDFFEIMFRGEGLKRIGDGRPAVICIEDREGESIIGVVETIYAMLYREKKGGRPKPTIFTDKNELKKDMRWIEAEDRIYVVQLSKKEWNSLEKEKEDWERFLNRINQLFLQDIGFIILNKHLQQKVHDRHYIKIITLEPRRLTIDMKRRLTEIAWGFVDVNDAIGHPDTIHIDAIHLDTLFDYGKKKFEDTLEGIKEIGFFALATNPHEEGESDEHRWVKWFLLKYLASQLIKKGELPKNPSRSQIQSKVKTEADLFGVKPDVYIGNGVNYDVYEVETLFSEDGEGSISSDKIIYTIDKYKNNNNVNINIVLSNITFIRHLKMIKKILRMYEKDGKKNIKFWTLDLKKEKLMSLEEILKIMRELKAEMGATYSN